MKSKRREENIVDHIEFGRMLDNYEDLSENDKLQMENHAEVCEECRRELEFYRSIMKTAASLPVIEPPADLLDKVNSRIDSMPKQNSRFARAAEHFRVYRVQYATAAACLAVGLIVGLNSGVIRDKLDPAATDGVISTTTRVRDNDERKLGDYELTGEPEAATEAVPEPTERVVAELPLQTAKPKKDISAQTEIPKKALPVQTARPRVAAKTATATAKPARQSVSVATPSSTRSAVSQPVAAKPAPVQTETSAAVIPETETNVTVVTETPSEPAENTSKNRYTIAKGSYYIPETAQANAEVTEAPTARPDTEIEGERYQIAMGSYEISEEEKKELARNKLIVNKSDVVTIIACMNSSWIKAESGGYTATQTAFANFLATLDAEGNYIQLSDTGSEVHFVLMAN